MWLILGGLFKKVVIANYLAGAIVDPVFGDPARHSSPEAIVAIVAYAVQIYCDFSGYTDIAIGVAKLLGFRFPAELRPPVQRALRAGVLAPLAHDAVAGGCATTSTSRSAGTGRVRRAPTST